MKLLISILTTIAVAFVGENGVFTTGELISMGLTLLVGVLNVVL
jgi:hypothetical protein